MRLPPRSLWWQGAALVIAPLMAWLATDGRFQELPQTAGGVHFTVYIDRLAPEKACLNMRAQDITANLDPFVCRP